MKTALAICFLLFGAVAQAQTPIADAVKKQTFGDKLDISLGITSLTMSGTAAGLTAYCLSEQLCEEQNQVMRSIYSRDIIHGTVTKLAVSGAVHYVAWKIPNKKARRGLLIFLAAFNTWDAVHDMRVLKRIGREND